MSYYEYMDMFYETQKQQCPYRAFTFDVVNSRNQTEYLETKSTKFFKLIDCIYFLLEQEEINTNKRILLKDKFNCKFDVTKPIKNNNEYNPMILGDMFTFFVYNGSITTKRLLEIFSTALTTCNINYSFHFKTGVYQTNDYVEGANKLFKGYMPQLLESLSKKNNFIIDRDFSSQNSRKLWE